MALQKDAIERDDIVDFEDGISDSEPTPEPALEVGEFGVNTKNFKKEDIQTGGEILRNIFEFPITDTNRHLYPPRPHLPGVRYILF